MKLLKNNDSQRKSWSYQFEKSEKLIEKIPTHFFQFIRNLQADFFKNYSRCFLLPSVLTYTICFFMKFIGLIISSLKENFF